jgi:Mg-chelatase subunit ChlD
MPPYESPLQKALREKRESAIAVKEKQAEKHESAPKKKIEIGSVENARDKIAIIFDDSGSMGGEPLEDAQDGTIEFMRNCIPSEVACAIYPLNKTAITITTDLPSLSGQLKNIRAKGSTPLFEKLREAQGQVLLDGISPFTRFIIFSDGDPDSTFQKEICIKDAQERKTPIDTVLITYVSETGWSRSHAYNLLKEVADRTGGYFLVFQRGKVNFKTAFKYLAPGLRLMLASESVRQDLQEGRLK